MMDTGIMIAVLSLLGTVIGSFAGILTSNKLVVYRLEQLEKKVQTHNNLIDRMYAAEKDISLIKEDQKVANHRIDDLENK